MAERQEVIVAPLHDLRRELEEINGRFVSHSRAPRTGDRMHLEPPRVGGKNTAETARHAHSTTGRFQRRIGYGNSTDLSDIVSPFCTTTRAWVSFNLSSWTTPSSESIVS